MEGIVFKGEAEEREVKAGRFEDPLITQAGLG